MYKYMTIDLNIFMSLLLLIIIIMIRSKQSYKSFSTRLFLLLCWSTILLLMLDAVTWIFNGYDYRLEKISIYAFYLSETLPLVIWLCYLDYHLHQSNERLRSRWYYMHPVILNSIFLVVNIFTNFFFYIDSDAMYQRGPGFTAILVINFAVLLAAILIPVTRRTELERRSLIVFVVFSLIPVAGGIGQLFVYGVSVIWNAVGLAVIFAYIFLETQKELRDHLTGLLNRQQIDELVMSRMIDYEKHGGFSIILLDMDDFKCINDRYGHKEGDRALVRLSEILYNSVKRIDRVARLGGDEFMILVEEERSDRILEIIKRIQVSLEKDNSCNERPYKLAVSIGFSVYSPKSYRDLTELFNAADRNMYAEKQGKKSCV